MYSMWVLYAVYTFGGYKELWCMYSVGGLCTVHTASCRSCRRPGTLLAAQSQRRSFPASTITVIDDLYKKVTLH